MCYTDETSSGRVVMVWDNAWHSGHVSVAWSLRYSTFGVRRTLTSTWCALETLIFSTTCPRVQIRASEPHEIPYPLQTQYRRECCERTLRVHNMVENGSDESICRAQPQFRGGRLWKAPWPMRHERNNATEEPKVTTSLMAYKNT
jgi:hypothetical protein